MSPWEQLLENISQKEVPSALLLHSRSMSKLRECSEVFSQRVLGNSPKLAKQLHPDLREFFPYGKGRLHPIETPRLIRNGIWVQPVESAYKLYVIHEADRMTFVAISAFLKVLEEPPAYGVFLLTTTRPQQLPATILSRCLVIPIEGDAVYKVSQEDLMILCDCIAGNRSILEAGQIVKHTNESERQLCRDKAKVLLKVLFALIRDRYMLSLGVSLDNTEWAMLVPVIPALPLEKVLVVFDKALEALDNSSLASSCIEWVILQLLSFKAAASSFHHSQ